MMDRHEAKEIAVAIGWFVFASIVLVFGAVFAASVV